MENLPAGPVNVADQQRAILPAKGRVVGLSKLARTVKAVHIPNGDTVPLVAGTPVTVTQALGGSFTVHAPTLGSLFRIDGADADALGLSAPVSGEETGGAVTEERVLDRLRGCFDPEIPVNVVDLGLVYDLTVTPMRGGTPTRGGTPMRGGTPARDGVHVGVKMTLTAPGCGMGPMLAQDVQNRLLGLEGIDDVAVELVWDPPWNQAMMTEAAKLQLGLM